MEASDAMELADSSWLDPNHPREQDFDLQRRPPSLGIIGGEPSACSWLRERLLEANDTFRVGLLPSATLRLQDTSALDLDIALIRLGGEDCEGVGVAAALSRRFPWVSRVLWMAAESHSIELPVARSLGLSNVLSPDDLVPWLAKAAWPLTRLARARHLCLEAEAEVPPVPTSLAAAEPLPACEPLPHAEQAFRTHYLRALLAHAPSRHEAARRAGVPYTTLVSMLKKLGLT